MRPVLIDLGREYRGGQHQALLLLQGLAARGHSPELIALRDSLLAGRANRSGIRVHSITNRWRRLSAAQTIRSLVAKRAVDIVHANEPHALTAAWFAGAPRQVPVIASRRVIFPLSRDSISLARYRASARIVAVSQYVAAAVSASGLPASRLIVIPDGVPIPQPRSAARRDAARRALGIAANVPLVGCVAVLTPDKGQAMLVRALASVRAQIPRCELLLVGDGPCRSEITALVNQNGLAGAVHFAGFVDELSDVYEALDLFAFPAQAEALGSALLSAMAHGLPVAALARGGIPEVVENGRNGILFAEPDPVALAAAIVQLFLHAEEAKRMGDAARETIEARYSVDRMVDATLQLYEGLLAANGQKSHS